MPASKAKLRAKNFARGDGARSSPAKQKKEPVPDEKARSLQCTNATYAKMLQEVEKEHKLLAEEAKLVREEHQNLLGRKDTELKMLDDELIEREALLKECQELEFDSNGSPANEKCIARNPDGNIKSPSKTQGMRKLTAFSESLARELLNLRRTKCGYTKLYVDEMQKAKIYSEILAILFRQHGDPNRSFGKIFMKNKIEEYERTIPYTRTKLETLKKKNEEITGSPWEKAEEKYGAEMRELMEEKGRLENDFLDQEEKLKKLQEREEHIDKDIASRQAKIERHSDINRKQIFNSVEFKELMEHRDGLIARIDKSVSVIEDTKEAYQLAIAKYNDLYLNLLKTQKRVQELTTKTFELTAENEQERMRMIGASTMMDYVSRELNAKNGQLLDLEVAVEELENKREMLEENLKHCLQQHEILEKKNNETEMKISECNEEYFAGAYGSVL